MIANPLSLWIPYHYESLIIMNSLSLWIPYDYESPWYHYESLEAVTSLSALWTCVCVSRVVCVWVCVYVASSVSFFKLCHRYRCCNLFVVVFSPPSLVSLYILVGRDVLERQHSCVVDTDMCHTVYHIFFPHYIFFPVWFHWYHYRSLGTVTSFFSSTAASSTRMCVTFFVPLHHISSMMSFLVHDAILGSIKL